MMVQKYLLRCLCALKQERKKFQACLQTAENPRCYFRYGYFLSASQFRELQELSPEVTETETLRELVKDLADSPLGPSVLSSIYASTALRYLLPLGEIPLRDDWLGPRFYLSGILCSREESEEGLLVTFTHTQEGKERIPLLVEENEKGMPPDEIREGLFCGIRILGYDPAKKLCRGYPIAVQQSE